MLILQNVKIFNIIGIMKLVAYNNCKFQFCCRQLWKYITIKEVYSYSTYRF